MDGAERERVHREYVWSQRSKEELSRELLRLALPRLVTIADWSSLAVSEAGRFGGAENPPMELEMGGENYRRSLVDGIPEIRKRLDVVERILGLEKFSE